MQESLHNMPSFWLPLARTSQGVQLFNKSSSSQLCPLLARRWSPYSYYPEKKSSNSTYLGLLCLLNRNCLLRTSWERLWLRNFLRLPSCSCSMIWFLWQPFGPLCLLNCVHSAPFTMLIICYRIPTFLFVPMNLLDTAPGWIFQRDIQHFIYCLWTSAIERMFSSLGFPGWSFEHDRIKSCSARDCDESDDLSTLKDEKKAQNCLEQGQRGQRKIVWNIRIRTAREESSDQTDVGTKG